MKLNLKRKIQRLLFNIKMSFIKNALVNSANNSTLIYPILVDLTFNEDYYWNKYLKNYSIQVILRRKLNKIKKRLLYPPNQETMKRYYRFKEYYQNQQENKRDLEYFFPDYFPKIGGNS